MGKNGVKSQKTKKKNETIEKKLTEHVTPKANQSNQTMLVMFRMGYVLNYPKSFGN